MAYRSLLVALGEGPQSDHRLRIASELAVSFGARLVGQATGAVAPPVYDPLVGGVVGDLFVLYREMAETHVQQVAARFAEATRDLGLPTEWKGEIGLPNAAVTRAALATDLVVLGGGRGEPAAHEPDPADVFLACGRPALIVPPGSPPAPLGARAIVAWKDGREARLALAGALPLLRRAAGVTLYAAASAAEAPRVTQELAELAAHLERHEIASRSVVAEKTEASTGRQILDHALDTGAGLIVAGGYGQSRLRELVLGGVTRHLLRDSPVCLLVAH